MIEETQTPTQRVQIWIFCSSFLISLYNLGAAELLNRSHTVRDSSVLITHHQRWWEGKRMTTFAESMYTVYSLIKESKQMKHSYKDTMQLLLDKYNSQSKNPLNIKCCPGDYCKAVRIKMIVGLHSCQQFPFFFF